MANWFKELIFAIKATIKPITLVVFESRGCMVHDWREIDRGKIVGKTFVSVYDGSKRKYAYLICERSNGSLFECFADDCQKGTREMQSRTENPDEDLSNKWVCVK